MTTDELLTILADHYGRAWDTNGDPAQVWKEWEHARTSVPPAWVESALKHLPQTPISALGFRALAVMHAPRSIDTPPAPRQTQQPAGIPPAIRAQLEALRTAATQPQADPLAWAKRLQERERKGERLTPLIRSMWRDVLKWKGPA